jgi:hypothetical protein
MPNTTEVTVQSLAAEAAGYFTAGVTREGEDQPIRILKDDRPDWVHELVYSAHGDFGPDDWRYNTIEDALLFIADTDDPDDGSGEFADSAVDVYNGSRLEWLSSNLRRAGYCDEAADELGSEGLDTFERIGLGQYFEASEVYGLVLRSLEDELAGRWYAADCPPVLTDETQ